MTSKPSGLSLTLETLTAQALGRIDEKTRALVPPLHTSTTYERDADGGYSSGRGYTRPHNPTYDEPVALLSKLEGGSDCLLFASGMAAATAVFQSLLPGDHVLVARVMYWALRTWLVDFALSWGLQVEFVDSTDLEVLKAAIRPGQTRLIWIETPANPTWDITDIAGAAAIARSARARLVVDSTVATPVLTRPLELGADLVVHSASKYLNGHSDVLAGAIVCAEQDGFWQRIRAWHRDAGAVLGPFEAWLLLRGMRTLFVRMQRCMETAQIIAEHFAQHKQLSQVLYPGLPGHPGHVLAKQQMHGGFSGMLSIRLRHGEAAAMATAARVQVFKRATSLGGVESLIEHRASIEGLASTVPADLLRLSIGLEDPQDLINDLEQALDHDTRSVVIDSSVISNTDDEQPVVAALKQRLQEQIQPLIADRGGELILRGFTAGIVELEISGSPGAVVPLQTAITSLLQHYIPEVKDIHFVNVSTASNTSLDVQQILEQQINPAVRSHGGFIKLLEVKEATAFIEFQGGCQGCAMADVTLRQGVEVMLKEQLPDLLAVVDMTDHAAGRKPYFKTKKGSA